MPEGVFKAERVWQYVVSSLPAENTLSPMLLSILEMKFCSMLCVVVVNL